MLPVSAFEHHNQHLEMDIVVPALTIPSVSRPSPEVKTYQPMEPETPSPGVRPFFIYRLRASTIMSFLS
uniref:Uncharacterized protein n=1 Tax=Utricularia reniformis TaxID=192314 RepID=A0A1Y0AYW5_9LAMI|nr:hypothetical protein AEK19_MT1189 [Utricularia reniformis]ART30356.1 hypothetical protein AEK19_MT1189 [Utricularia reniformis]